MANNADILGEEASVRQIVGNNFSSTDGAFIDDTVLTIRERAFSDKTLLHKALFKNANNIKGYAFYGCTIMALCDMGESNIGVQTFFYDNMLIALILRKETLSTLANTNAFTSTKYATNGAGGAYVYVPRALISSYQTATNWATLYAAHSDMFRALEDYTVDGTITGELDEEKILIKHTPVYSLDEQSFDGETYFDSGIQLYDTVDSEFTIVLTYTLEQWTTNARILHCRDESVSEGLRYGRHVNINNNAMIHKNAPGTSAMSADGLGLGGSAGDYIQVYIVGTKTGIRVYHRVNSNTPSPNNTSYTYSGTRTTMDRTLLIGAGKDSSNNLYGYFKGTIHKLRVYKDVLEDWEIWKELKY